MDKLLLIEDDELIRELYERQLKKAGYSVDTAENGKLGAEQAAKTDYTLILLDVMMPVMNGLDAYKQMKSKGVTAPVVFLTNLGQETIVDEGMKLGAKAYLIKASMTPSQMIDEVKKILANIKNG